MSERFRLRRVDGSTELRHPNGAALQAQEIIPASVIGVHGGFVTDRFLLRKTALRSGSVLQTDTAIPPVVAPPGGWRLRLRRPDKLGVLGTARMQATETIPSVAITSKSFALRSPNLSAGLRNGSTPPLQGSTVVTKRFVTASDSFLFTEPASYGDRTWSQGVWSEGSWSGIAAAGTSASIVVHLSVVDASVFAEGSANQSAPVNVNDVIAFAEVASVAVRQSVVESIAAIDLAATSAQFSVTDTGAFSDSSQLLALFAVTDASAFADHTISEASDAAISWYDSITADDEASLQVLLSVSDAATSTDATGAPIGLSVVDGVTVSDAASLIVALTVFDAAASGDSSTLFANGRFFVTDGVKALDTAALVVKLAVADTGALVDVTSLAASINTADPVSVVDRLQSQVVSHSGADSISAVDSSSLRVNQALVDNAVVGDAAVVTFLLRVLAAFDRVHVGEDAQPAVTVSATDAVAATDHGGRIRVRVDYSRLGAVVSTPQARTSRGVRLAVRDEEDR